MVLDWQCGWAWVGSGASPNPRSPRQELVGLEPPECQAAGAPRGPSHSPLTLISRRHTPSGGGSSVTVPGAALLAAPGHSGAQTPRHLSKITFRYENQWPAAKHKQSRSGEAAPRCALSNTRSRSPLSSKDVLPCPADFCLRKTPSLCAIRRKNKKAL